MKKLHLCLLFLLAVLTASSQKVYFVYIQTESEQPFFVKMNEKVHSSLLQVILFYLNCLIALIVLVLVFLKINGQNKIFSITVNRKDHGYLLKNFGEKGWGLFDLQTLTIQMSVTGKSKHR